MRNGGIAVLVGCVAVLAAGCGGEPPTYPVRGQVVFKDGKPLQDSVVEVGREADDLKDQVNYSAPIDAEGRFQLQAREGTYRAILVPVQDAKGGVEGSAVVPRFPRRYMTYSDSGLRMTVTSDAAGNEVRWTIDRP